MIERDIQRWSREVAEDPGAPSFVPLARAYRRQGRRDAAREMVFRGLERNPEHVDAHALLALIHVEEGEREKAGDEWETVLRLDPGNFDASRGLGFLALERGDLPTARRHLDTAARARPDDPAVSQARQLLARREARATRDPGAGDGARPVAAPSASADSPAPAGRPHGPVGPPASSAKPAGADAGANGRRDPLRLFDALHQDAPFLGALVVDPHGLVLAGALEREQAAGELLGALLQTAVDEARRTAELIRVGPWEELLLDCDGATLHVAPLEDGALVVTVARAGAPAGWVLRTAERARDLARSFLGVAP